jgi:hypothetical protein
LGLFHAIFMRRRVVIGSLQERSRNSYRRLAMKRSHSNWSARASLLLLAALSLPSVTASAQYRQPVLSDTADEASKVLAASNLATPARSDIATEKQAQQSLPVRVDRVKSVRTIPAGTVWDSPVQFGESCAFDLKVEYDETFTTWTFNDHEYIRILIQDRYRNLATGFAFVDRADYVIQHDFATNIAFHAGIFWLVQLPDRGIVVRDTGTFTQNWSGDFPWPVENLTGPYHDVNGVPFGTLSYCDWEQGRFP